MEAFPRVAVPAGHGGAADLAAHGIDAMLRAAWKSGIVPAVLSAGSMCWFEWGITTSSGAPRRRAPAPTP